MPSVSEHLIREGPMAEVVIRALATELARLVDDTEALPETIDHVAVVTAELSAAHALASIWMACTSPSRAGIVTVCTAFDVT